MLFFLCDPMSHMSGVDVMVVMERRKAEVLNELFMVVFRSTKGMYAEMGEGKEGTFFKLDNERVASELSSFRFDVSQVLGNKRKIERFNRLYEEMMKLRKEGTQNSMIECGVLNVLAGIWQILINDFYKKDRMHEQVMKNEVSVDVRSALVMVLWRLGW